MVFVKVRETYDLHTIKNKISIIGIHTPKAPIVKRNYPGLLMQCKSWRPVSCDVKIACASMLPLDPQGIGLTDGDVAPEDVFNPILYKACSNFSMDQLEKLINSLAEGAQWGARGDSVDSTNDGLTSDDFNIYYGLLSDTHGWKHASAQSGLVMNDLRPLVYEKVYTTGSTGIGSSSGSYADGIPADGPEYALLANSVRQSITEQSFKGKAKPMPWLPTTVAVPQGTNPSTVEASVAGFGNAAIVNATTGVIAPRIFCGVIVVPPSRLHQLFYRLVCEWTLEFSGIRSFQEITSWNGIGAIGSAQHVMDYDFSSKLMTEETDLIDTSEDSGIHKVM